MEFDWDEGNRDKNLRHGVHDWEIEQALQDPRARQLGRLGRHMPEARFGVLGRCSTSGKYLRIVYTIRVRGGARLVRPISATEMTTSQRRAYRNG